METIDDETSSAALGFIECETQAGKHWFVGWNDTRMHFCTHVKKNYAVSPVTMNTVMVWLSMIVISVYF